MKLISGVRQWFRHLVYWFFDASQGDAVPRLEPMLAPRNFSNFVRTSPSRGGKITIPGKAIKRACLVEVGCEKHFRVRKPIEILAK